MVNSDDPLRVDQHVTALLLCVTLWPAGQHSSKQFTEVRPPHCWTHEIFQPGFPHAVGTIKLAVLVDEHGPRQLGLNRVLSGDALRLEGDDDNLNIEVVEALYRLLHLHEVPSARQSPEMPVEYDQQPAPTVILQAADCAVGIGQRKPSSRLTNETGHEGEPSKLPTRQMYAKSRAPDTDLRYAISGNA
jgi:hypothetical protein